VADVLFGAVNPGGKLPISFPRDVGHIPVHYNRKPASTGPYFTGDTDPTSRVPSAPLFPFGHGLSYTTFNYSGLSISPRKSNASGVINIQCKVTNAGKVKGDEVVQLYIHDEVASCSRPVKELKAFQRVTLSPGKSKTITFKLSLDQLAFYDPQMRFVVEPGSFEAQIGSSSEDIRLRGRFVVTGQPKIVMSQRKFFTEIEVK
jgi:beta-glucosidase